MNIRQMMQIIAEEIGCPSFIHGISSEFHFCCDRDKHSPPNCYCENAAKRIALQQNSITEPKRGVSYND